MLDEIRKIDKLSAVQRYMGLTLIKPESDADHIASMTSIALAIFSKLPKGIIDIRELVYKIAIHDQGECVSGDIVRPFKHYDREISDEINRVEHILMLQEFPEFLVSDIDNAKDDSIEGMLTSFIDSVQCVTKLIQEVKMGNSLVRDELNNCFTYMKSKWSDDYTKFPSPLDKIVRDLITEIHIEVYNAINNRF